MSIFAGMNLAELKGAERGYGPLSCHGIAAISGLDGKAFRAGSIAGCRCCESHW